MSEFSDYMDATIGSTPVAATVSESEPWTPTTNQVRDGFRYDPEAEYRDPITPHHEINGRAFDRWLAKVKATAAAEALNAAAQEAYERGDIGKDEGPEAWNWLRVRAAQALDRTP